jgi:hypothetical protein
MKKIKTVFVINRDEHVASADILPASAWVLDEGLATVKFDGTSSMLRNGILYKRYDVRQGKVAPADAIPCEAEPDAKTGHWPHWIPVRADEPSDRWHLEAMAFMAAKGAVEDGTYELLGPKVQGNLYDLPRHILVRHGALRTEVERSRDGIIRWLNANAHEGIVFHHPDGRLAKVRRKDFSKAEVARVDRYDGGFLKSLI